jgi:hypothetical protein
LGDALALIAAVAVGFALARQAFSEHPLVRLGKSEAPGFRVAFTVEMIYVIAMCCVAALTLALLILRLRSPRPSLLALLHQPGIHVGLNLITLLFAGGLGVLLTDELPSLRAVVLTVPFYNGIFLPFWWLSLWGSGYWSREPGWLDTTGLILGACWIGLLLLNLLSLCI